MAPEAAYDAIWAIALALNKTAAQLNTNGTGCEYLNGALNVTLDKFTYDNARLACVLKNNLASTNFVGASVGINIACHKSGSVFFCREMLLLTRRELL